ncbi:hypothetical protein D3C83_156590 [compost metagenome]
MFPNATTTRPRVPETMALSRADRAMVVRIAARATPTSRGNAISATEPWTALMMRERLSATTYRPIASGRSRPTTSAWSR